MTGPNLFLSFIKADLRPPFLLISCGLPCTLKSTVVDEIARLKGCTVLRTDAIRRELLDPVDIYDASKASDMNLRTRIYGEMFARADKTLSGSGCLILDATFITRALRERAAGIAARHEVAFIIIETVSPRETALRRLRERDRASTESNAVTAEAYYDNERRFEPVDIAALSGKYPSLRAAHITVDTSEFAPESWKIISREERP